MIQAAGCCFLSLETGRIMLQQRSETVSHPFTWSFWGGKSEKDERPIETLLRECNEEMGMLPEIEKIYPLHCFTSNDDNFVYHTFLVTVYEEFCPQTNSESSGYAWVNSNHPPMPLHRGAKTVLKDENILSKIDDIWEHSKEKVRGLGWLESF